MTEPSGVIEVAKDDLYREADLWDKQSLRIDDCAFQARHLTIDAYDVMLANQFLSAYNEVTRVIARLCGQGVVVTRELAQTLRTVANTYGEADDGIRAQYNRI